MAGIPSTQLFACDIDKSVQQLIADNFDVGSFVGDVHAAQHKLLPTTDVYFAWFPCQPYAMGGGNGGHTDQRASVANPIIAHIGSTCPKNIVLENGMGLATTTHIGDFINIKMLLLTVIARGQTVSLNQLF